MELVEGPIGGQDVSEPNPGESSMKLYVGVLSLFSAKARIALSEKGVEPELVTVGWSREHRYLPHHPDVAALNPKAQVPVLVDGDVVVYDSTQIFEYLEERLPEPPLYPDGIADRARCRRLEAHADETWFPQVWDLIEQRFYADGSGSEQQAAGANSAITALYEELDKELLTREYLCERFSVADIAMFIQVHTAGVLGAPVPEGCEAVASWCRRVSERGSVAPVLSDMLKAAVKVRAQA